MTATNEGLGNAGAFFVSVRATSRTARQYGGKHE
jgi:hypothetical protein